MTVKLTNYTQNPMTAIDEAAANCYNTDITKDGYQEGRLMRGCINSGHLSVTEFAQFTFHIEGVSRALTHQLVRHRLASFAQRSQRYCGENEFEYVIPHTIEKNNNLKLAYIDFMKKINQMYTDLQELGIPNEDARMVLPNACCSSIEVSMNFRQLMHFMNERLCTRAQWEIRELALAMKKAVEEECPYLAKYLVPKCEKESLYFCPERQSCGRHKTVQEIKERLEEE